MPLPLSGLRVLLLHPGFFALGSGAARGLELAGASVASWCTRPSTSPSYRAGLRLAPWLGQAHVTRALAKRFRQSIQGSFDVVIAVGGEGLAPRAVSFLRALNPRARFILYLFDSVANSPRCLPRVAAFDEVVSFDRADCESRPGWRYRPLFATEEYWQRGPVGCRGVCFVGSYHAERIMVLRRWIAACHDRGIPGEYAVATRGWPDRLRWRPNRLDAGISRLGRPLSANECIAIYRAYGVVFDVHHPRQTGLTMRTLEALACGCRLVTTNPMIMRETFYDPERILVVDRSNPVPCIGFFLQPRASRVTPLDPRFTAAEWGKEVVGI